MNPPPANTPPEWQVDLYQLGCYQDGVGEAGILIVADKSANSQYCTAGNPGSRGTIVKAILIDAGVAKHALEVLVETMDTIHTAYAYSEPVLQFDAVIISHWDRDHWFAFAKASKNLLNHPDVGLDSTTGKVRCFKYSATKSECTQLYCQYWSNPQRRPLAKAVISATGQNTYADSAKGPFDVKLAGTKTTCCRAWADPALILGTNVITGVSLATSTAKKVKYTAVKTLDDLISNNNPWSDDGKATDTCKGRPGLYIVGARGHILGSTSSITMAMAARGPRSAGSDIHVNVVDEHGIDNPNNPESLMLLLVWKSDATPPVHRISLYSGGDAEWEAEGPLATFLRSSDKTVRAVKIGHHGSLKSTPAALINQARPETVFLSAGFDHFHPRAEVVWMLDAFFRSKEGKKASPSNKSNRFFATCYPYWLGKVLEANGNVRYTITGRKDARNFVRAYDGDRGWTQKTTTAFQNFSTQLNKYYASASYGKKLNPVQKLEASLKQVEKDKDDAEKERDDAQDALKTAKANLTKNKKNTAAAAKALKKAVDDATKALSKANDKYNDLEKAHKVNTWAPAGALVDSMWATWSSVEENNFPFMSAYGYGTRGYQAALQYDGMEIEYISYILAEFVADETTDGNFEVYVSDDKFEVDISQAKKPKTFDKKVGGLTNMVVRVMDSGGTPTSESKKRRAEEISPSFNVPLTVQSEQALLNAQTTLSLDSEDLGEDVPEPVHEKDSAQVVPARSLNLMHPLAALMSSIAYPTSSGTFTSFVCSDSTDSVSTAKIPASYTVLDDFIASLETRKIPFTSPLTSEALKKIWKQSLSTDCELIEWFNKSLPDPPAGKNFIVTGSMSGPSSTSFLDGFDFELSYAGKQTMSYSSRPADVSAATGAQLDFVNAFIGAEGLMLGSSGLILGLKPFTTGTETSWSLDELYTLMDSKLPIFLRGTLKATLDPKRVNCIWLSTIPDKCTTIRIGASVTAADGGQPDLFIVPIPQTNFSNITFDGRRKTLPSIEFVDNPDPNYQTIVMDISAEILLSARLTLLDKKGLALKTAFDTAIMSISNGLRLSLRPVTSNLTSQNILSDLIAWVGDVTGVGDFFGNPNGTSTPGSSSPQSWLNSLTKGVFGLREAEIDMKYTKSQSWFFYRMAITFEVDLDWGVDDPSNTVPVSLTFVYTRNTGNMARPKISFKGQLWQKIDQQLVTNQNCKPNASLIPRLAPSSPSTAQYYISLEKLLQGDNRSDRPKYSTLPNGIPNQITCATMTLSQDVISFMGRMDMSEQKTQEAPRIYLSSIMAAVSYKPAAREVDLSFDITVKLTDRWQQYTATLIGSVDFVNQPGKPAIWILTAAADELQLSNLYSLFLDADNDAIMNALENVSISSFNMEYTYGIDGLGSTFETSGLLQICDFSLDLDFWYGKKGPGTWEFSASLYQASVDSPVRLNLTKVLTSISPSLGGMIPDFFDEFRFEITQDDKVQLDCKKITTQKSGAFIAVMVAVKTKSLQFSYLQFSSTADQTSVLTKRIVRLVLDGLPTPQAKDVPLMGTIESPFKRVEFLWTNFDLTRHDIDEVANPIYDVLKDDRIVYQDPTQQTRDATSIDPADVNNDILIRSGSHIIIIAEQQRVPTVVMDYCFTPTASKASSTAESTVPDIEGGSDARDTAASATNGTDHTAEVNTESSSTSSTMSHQQGPLTISGLTVGYDKLNQAVSIQLNALIKLGPLECSLLGFGVSMPVSNLQHFDISTITTTLSGVGMELNRPPVIVAGELVKKDQSYFGGLAVEVEPYAFLAAGFYGNMNTYKSIFVFAALEGPFVELEFASLSGLTVGFGYNTDVRQPTVDDILKFPFLAPIKGSDPLETLNSLIGGTDPWFTTSNGPIWFAAGLTAELFHVIGMKAAVLVDIQPNDVILGVYADCTASVPADVGDAEKFAEVDIAVFATLDFAKGTFRMQGVLTPKSFILDKSCRLTGGFALCYWFAGSGHEGDWVFTVGGFHPSFRVPDWYPKPGRLAITWTYDDTISIYGDAYFAVTPKACMGGGRLHLVFSSGRLYASLDAYADFLMNIEPFNFTADAGVSVKASYTLGWGWCSKTAHLDVDASIHLHGPPLAGTAHVDWSVFAFDVEFGTQPKPIKPVTWDSFCRILRQSDNRAPGDGATSEKPMLALKATGGLVGDPTKQEGEEMRTAQTAEWCVDGPSFKFRVSMLVPASRATLNRKSDVKDLGGDAFFLKPLQTTQPASSQLDVTITEKGNSNATVNFSWSKVMKLAPEALWGPYDLSQDPSYGMRPAALFDPKGATRNLCMGLDLQAPGPQTSQRQYSVEAAALFHSCTDKAPWDKEGSSVVVKSFAIPALAPAVAADVKAYVPSEAASLGELNDMLFAQNGNAMDDMMRLWGTFSSAASQSTYALRTAALLRESAASGQPKNLMDDYKSGLRAMPLFIKA